MTAWSILTPWPEPRPSSGPRVTGTGFAWTCRKALDVDGELVPCDIAGDDRREYERHVKAHGEARPVKSGYQRPKPWTPPKPKEYAPRPLDPGQPVEWDCAGTVRTGVIWAGADTGNSWWVQPDENPARPVYVRRALVKDYPAEKGSLIEIPQAADAARANLVRGNLVRERGIYPVIHLYRPPAPTDPSSGVYVRWHADPACPAADGKEPFDPGNHPDGPVHGYRPENEDQPWTPYKIAVALIENGQPPSELCGDCITGLAVDLPAAITAPDHGKASEPDRPESPATEPAAPETLPEPATAAKPVSGPEPPPGPPPVLPARPVLQPEPPAEAEHPLPPPAAPDTSASWKAIVSCTVGFEPEDDSGLLSWMDGEKAGMTAYADGIQSAYETAVNSVGLDPAAMAALHDCADAALDAAEKMAAARNRFTQHYEAVREFTGSGGVLPHNGQFMTGN